jgi:hypothetical protein
MDTADYYPRPQPGQSFWLRPLPTKSRGPEADTAPVASIPEEVEDIRPASTVVFLDEVSLGLVASRENGHFNQEWFAHYCEKKWGAHELICARRPTELTIDALQRAQAGDDIVLVCENADLALLARQLRLQGRLKAILVPDGGRCPLELREAAPNHLVGLSQMSRHLAFAKSSSAVNLRNFSKLVGSSS